MALPLPPIQPGGDFLASMAAANAVKQSSLENQIKAIQAKYAPLTTQAEAASKLAYANLMGPQFLSKLMGHPEILANMTEEQRNNALRTAYNAGTGQTNGLNIFNALNAPKEETMFDLLKNKLRNLSPNNNTPKPMDLLPPGSNDVNALLQNPILSEQDRNAISNLREGESYTIPTNQPMQQPEISPEIPSRAKNWFERTAEAKGIESEGTEAGKLRAQDIQELNTTAFNANTMQTTLNELSNIVNTPEFRQIRQIPIAGQHEMGWYAKFGTPEQKRLIGKFLAEQGNVVVNAASQFKGAFRVGEQALINTMKVNPSDMPDVAVGKINAMSLMNQMLQQRSAITARLMEDHHLSKGKAMEIADKQVDGNKIREQLDNSIMITIKNKKTGEKMTVPLNKAKEMGVPNV